MLALFALFIKWAKHTRFYVHPSIEKTFTYPQHIRIFLLKLPLFFLFPPVAYL